MRSLKMRGMALAGVAVLALTACGGGSEGDRATAVDNLQSLLDGDEETANCIIDEFGEDRLGDVDNFDAEADGSEEQAADAAEAITTCMLGSLGDLADELDGIEGGDVDDEEPIDCSSADVDPCDYGDDAELDALWDGCEGGSGADCDALYFDSPVGSRYEQYGNTCGDRGFEVSCESVYSE